VNENHPTADASVSESVGRTLQLILERLGAEKVDRIWIFPPLVKGRREFGLVAVSGLTDEPTQRALYTARYSSELTGTGRTFESEVSLEGSAPPDRLPRVMDGVIRRSDLQLGDAKEIAIQGDAQRLQELVKSYGWEPPKENPEEEI
jgi:hypothetical protein